MATAGDLRLDSSACSSGRVDWELVDADSGLRKSGGSGCAGISVPGVPAGNYRPSVFADPTASTYRLDIITA